jgi:hypothetical protein
MVDDRMPSLVERPIRSVNRSSGPSCLGFLTRNFYLAREYAQENGYSFIYYRCKRSPSCAAPRIANNFCKVAALDILIQSDQYDYVLSIDTDLELKKMWPIDTIFTHFDRAQIVEPFSGVKARSLWDYSFITSLGDPACTAFMIVKNSQATRDILLKWMAAPFGSNNVVPSSGIGDQAIFGRLWKSNPQKTSQIFVLATFWYLDRATTPRCFKENVDQTMDEMFEKHMGKRLKLPCRKALKNNSQRSGYSKKSALWFDHRKKTTCDINHLDGFSWRPIPQDAYRTFGISSDVLNFCGHMHGRYIASTFFSTKSETKLHASPKKTHSFSKKTQSLPKNPR